MKKLLSEKKYQIIIFTTLGIILLVLIIILFKDNIESVFNVFNDDKKSETKLEMINFEKMDFVCKEGESFETIIKADTSNKTTVKSYYSDDTSIVSVDDKVSNIPKCYNCKAIRVNCHKEGNTILTAISSKGVKTIANVKVEKQEEKKEAIYFEENSYTCKAGQSFETIIRTDGTNKVTVTSYYSSDTSIASVDDKVNNIPKCYNCKAIRVKCHKKGEVNLTAVSSNGVSKNVSLKVVN